MKFGDFIENHLVPEWRSQYLDYFKGKVKLQRLEKFLDTSLECQCSTAAPVAAAVQSPPLVGASLHDNDFHSMLARDHRGLPNKKKSDYEVHGDVLAKTRSHFSLDTGDEDEDEENDDEDLKVVPLISKLDYNAPRRSGDITPLLGTTTSHLSYTKPEENHPVGHHRSHSTSILYIRNQRASLTEEHKYLIDLAKQRFIDWVDVELFKVNSFYKSKEFECTKRFLILVDQLSQLEQHEAVFKKTDITHIQDSSDHVTQPTQQSVRIRPNDVSVTNNSRKCTPISGLGSVFNSVSILERVHFIFNYFEMPSFPSYYWKTSTSSRQNSNTSDLGEQDSLDVVAPPPPFISKIMIKKAICELYHTMELLNSFRVANRTAFRKLMKKYDKRCHESKLPTYLKKVDSMYFNTSEVLTKLTENVEDIFTTSFEEGHRKTAIAKLRSFAMTKSHYRSNFLSGYLIGVSCPFIIFFLLDVYARAKSGSYPDEKYVLQLWGSWFLFVLAGLLFVLNCVVWDKYKINYKLVFELNPNDALDYKQYMVIPSVLLFVGSLLAFSSSKDSIVNILDFKHYPYIYFYFLLFMLFCPFNIFHLKARIWFIVSLFRLFLSGFYPVEFRDFFMGVLTCSLTYPIANIYMLFCLKQVDWNTCLTCGPMKSHILGICACIPPLWRSMQCLRRFLDTGEWFPHFANLAKYLITTLYFYTLSVYRITTYRDASKSTSNSTEIGITAFFITVSTVNSAYSSFWDVCMDWSLMQLSSDNYLLRDVLIYKRKPIYYAAIAFDILMRFQWVVYVFTPYKISHSALTAFAIAVAELIRRFVWMFFRMENEHATNVNLFRVSRVCPLPYNFTNKSIVNSKSLTQFAKRKLKLDLQTLFKQSNNIPVLDIETVEDIEDTMNHTLPSATPLSSPNLSGLPDLEAPPLDVNDILQHDSDVVSIHSIATQHMTATAKQSGWQQLSRIISRAHTKEFQQRNTNSTQKRLNNHLSGTNPGVSLDLDEELDMVADSNGDDVFTDDEDRDVGSSGSIASN